MEERINDIIKTEDNGEGLDLSSFDNKEIKEDTKDESGIEVAGKVKSGELEEDVEVIKENEEA